MVDVSAFTGTALTVVQRGLFVVVALGIGAFVVWFGLREKKYRQYKCVIWEKDTFGNIVEKTDWAGVFVDKKTRNKLLFLRKHKVGLSPDSIPFIPKIGGIFAARRVLYLFQTGLKNFHFIKPKITNPSVSLSVTEEDLNWGANAYEREKLRTQSMWLNQLLPYLGLLLLFLGVIIVSWFLMKKYDTIIEGLNIAKEIVAQNQAAASGTTVVQ